MWRDLGAALALVLVLEGIWPFVDPAGFRRAVQRLALQDDRFLRGAGLAGMGAGLVLLYLVRH